MPPEPEPETPERSKSCRRRRPSRRPAARRRPQHQRFCRHRRQRRRCRRRVRRSGASAGLARTQRFRARGGVCGGGKGLARRSEGALPSRSPRRRRSGGGLPRGRQGRRDAEALDAAKRRRCPATTTRRNPHMAALRPRRGRCCRHDLGSSGPFPRAREKTGPPGGADWTPLTRWVHSAAGGAGGACTRGRRLRRGLCELRGLGGRRDRRRRWRKARGQGGGSQGAGAESERKRRAGA